MRWNALSSQAYPSVQLKEDFGAARDLGKVRLGHLGIYFTRFAKTDYLPYEQVSRIWLRQEEINAQLCCGRAGFDQFYLVAQDKSSQIHQGQLLNLALGKQALAELARLQPDIPQGVGRAQAAAIPLQPEADAPGAE